MKSLRLSNSQTVLSVPVHVSTYYLKIIGTFIQKHIKIRRSCNWGHIGNQQNLPHVLKTYTEVVVINEAIIVARAGYKSTASSVFVVLMGNCAGSK